MLWRFAALMFTVGLMALDAGGVCGQDYPNKPIRILTGSAGGGVDLVARLIAQELAVSLDQQVIVENRPGILIGGIVSKAPPDGYTMLLYTSSLWIGPLLEKMPYDPVKDFAPITLIGRQCYVLVVHPSLPAKSVKELIALARSRPGALNYATSGGLSGGSNQLAAELFKAMASVNIVRIPYKGSAVSLNGLIGGEVHLMFASTASAAPHVKSGRLRALAVTSAESSALFPGLPTVAASGLLGYESVQTSGLFTPVKTPATIIDRLNQEIVRILNKTDVKERFSNAGVEPVGSSPEQFATKIKAELASMGKVIKDAGIKAE